MAEDEFHALWDCEKVREAWTPVFEEVRRKGQRLLVTSDLVSFIMAEGLRLELFAMTAWLIWMRRNKLRTNDNPLPCSKELSQQRLISKKEGWWTTQRVTNVAAWLKMNSTLFGIARRFVRRGHLSLRR
nr:hypothetical protein CFP56_71428 [Quercus suber]